MPNFEKPFEKDIQNFDPPFLPLDLQTRLRELQKKGRLSDPEREEFLELQAREEKAKEDRYGKRIYPGYKNPITKSVAEKTEKGTF